MWVFPLVAALVALVFAGMLIRRYLERRRFFQLLWAAALLMYSGASIALVLGVSSGWTTGEYRAFWLLGAVLNVPFLAAGELELLARRRVVSNVLLLVLVFATAFAFNRVRTAAIDPAALVAELPRGSEVFADDPFALRLARIYSYAGYFILVAGALWSTWTMRGASELRNRFLGTLLIALGATIVAAGSAFAAAGNLPGFSVTITAGIAIMFRGFLLASRPMVVRVPDVSGNGSMARGPSETRNA